MKKKVQVSDEVKNRLYSNKSLLINKLETREITSREEAVEIGIRMAKEAIKGIKFDLDVSEQKS